METTKSPTYLTTGELALRIKYDARSIRETLKDSVHYIRPFGRRKILYIRDASERDMANWAKRNAIGIPMANATVAHG